MSKLIHWAGRIGVAAAATLLAGCNLASSPGGPATGPSVTVRQNVPRTALLAVLTRPASGPALSGLLASTARPNEDIRILQAGRPARTIVASDSPAPSAVVLPGQPLAPGGGQTDYQMAQYAKRQKAWQAKRTADLAATRREDARAAPRPGWPGWTFRRSSAGWPTHPSTRAAWPPRARSRPARWRAWRRRQATPSGTTGSSCCSATT